MSDGVTGAGKMKDLNDTSAVGFLGMSLVAFAVTSLLFLIA